MSNLHDFFHTGTFAFARKGCLSQFAFLIFSVFEEVNEAAFGAMTLFSEPGVIFNEQLSLQGSTQFVSFSDIEPSHYEGM